MRIKKGFYCAVGALGLMVTLQSKAAFMDNNNQGSPVEGRRAFLKNNCYGCHGGRGGGGMGPNLRGGTDIEVDEAVQGLPGGMPRFNNLTDTDVNNLKAYFQTFRTPQEPTFTHWWEPVPTQ